MISIARAASVLFVLLLASSCTGELGSSRVWPGAGPSTGAGPDASVTGKPVIQGAASQLLAADPKLDGFDGWPLRFDVSGAPGGARCVLTFERDGLVLRTLESDVSGGVCETRWDGRGVGGEWVAPGGVRVDAILRTSSGEQLATTDLSVEVVRLGIREVRLDPTEPGRRSPLIYRAMGGVTEGFYLVPADAPPWRLGPDASEGDAAVSLELADGTPRGAPMPWFDLASPPLDARSPDGAEHDTYNLPTAFVAGSDLEVTAVLSSEVAGHPGGRAPAQVAVRVVPPDGTSLLGSDASFEPDGEVVVRSESSPVPAVGRYDWSLTWRFEAVAADGSWVRIPGSVETVHRLYGLVGIPDLQGEGVPYGAWVDVVDQVATWVDGASSSPSEVSARVVEEVHRSLGLRYEWSSGASRYTNLLGTTWDSLELDLSSFQERLAGSEVNCADAAGIVSTYANMVGADLRYHILRSRRSEAFDLNYIRAIGFDGFSETPFENGGGSFSFHAVVGPPDGTLYDATLALDGDADPMAAPFDPLLVQGLDPDRYVRALSSEWADVYSAVDRKMRLR